MRFAPALLLALTATLHGSAMRDEAPRDTGLSSPPTVALPPVVGTATGTAMLSGPFPVEVLEVVDGDTVAVRVTIWLEQQVVTRVRLRGIDAPELSSGCAQERRMAEAARQALGELLRAGRVDLFEVSRDKYGGRVLGRLRTGDGRDVAAQMLASGQARPYAGGRRGGWCDSVSARR